MDVTFVLEESGVTATVEVPCEADAAAAKEVACTALAVSPASVEMRIGTQVLEGTCRLQDTAFDAGVQVVLARPCLADIKCPAEYSVEAPPGGQRMDIHNFSLSPCGALCLFIERTANMNLPTLCYVTGLDTETLSSAFRFKVDIEVYCAPAISRCKTRCYLMTDCLAKIALPGGEVLRKVDSSSHTVFARGNVVISQGKSGVSVYDEDLTLLRSLSHEGCLNVALSDCGGWVITSSYSEHNVRLWDVNTGEAVACVPVGNHVALSATASVFAVECSDKVQLYDWSGAALRSFKKCHGHMLVGLQFTPCGKYLVVWVMDMDAEKYLLHQYDVATMSCVRVIPDCDSCREFTLSPCSRVVLFTNRRRDSIVTRHLHPY